MGLLADIKQTYSPTYAPTIKEKFAEFAPTIAPQSARSYQLDYQFAPVVAIESPQTQGSVQSTKKEAKLEPYSNVSPEFSGGGQSPNVSPSVDNSSEDNPLMMIAILAGVGIAGYVIFKGLSKKGGK